jgi:hypothetical protein
MKECRAINKKGITCSKKVIWGSRYCIIHQDPIPLLFAFLISFVASALILLIPEKKPRLRFRSEFVQEHNLSSIKCTIYNSGRADATNVYIGFSERLIVGTEISADSYVGATLEKSTNLLNPNINPEKAKLQKAFSIFIPRIAAKDTISVLIFTTDTLNLRTAKHYVNLLHEVRKKLLRISEIIKEVNPKDAEKIDIELLMSIIKKEHSFFKPLNLNYEGGKESISFISKKESDASEYFQSLIKLYSVQLLRNLKITEEYQVPVVRIETTNGIVTSAKILPYIGQYAVFSDIPKDMYKKEGSYYFPLPIPESYMDIIKLDNPKDYTQNFEAFIRKPDYNIPLKKNQSLGISVKFFVETKDGTKEIASGDSVFLKSVTDYSFH